MNNARLSPRTGDHSPFAELSVVRLARDFDAPEGRLLQGSPGVVVFTYDDGAAYEIEFHSPIHAVVTLDAADLTH